MALAASAAETLTLTDGTTVSGNIIKFDDRGIMLRDATDAYVNIPWAKFSQDALMQLVANPKIKPFAEVFIEPDQSKRPVRPEISVNPVQRMERPAHLSIFGGLAASAVGGFILLVLYLANLYAAFEVSLIRARPILQVVGLAAVLPILGPIIFLAMPVRVEPAPVVDDLNEAQAPAKVFKASEDKPAGEAEVGKPEKSLDQVFARGKFTFNKRFMETKFANHLGVPKGDALNLTMSLKSPQGQFTVERIAQVGASDVMFDTVERGQITVALADILEIKLTPKAA